MLRMIQSASKVVGYMFKSILESFWSSHSFSKMLVFLVLLLSVPSKTSSYPKMRNDSVWLILWNWCFWRAFDSLESSHRLYIFLNVLIPLWIFIPRKHKYPSCSFTFVRFYSFLDIFAFACFFFCFLSTIALVFKTGLAITSSWYDLVNCRWLLSMSLEFLTQFLFYLFALTCGRHFENILKPFSSTRSSGSPLRKFANCFSNCVFFPLHYPLKHIIQCSMNEKMFVKWCLFLGCLG